MGLLPCLLRNSPDAIKGQEQEYYSAGMDGFISKPINRVKFDKLVSEYLSHLKVDPQEVSILTQETKHNLLQNESRTDLVRGRATIFSNEYGLDHETSENIIADFYKNWDERNADFNEAIVQNDLGAIRSHAHYFKSSGGLCMDETHDICKKMEKMADNGEEGGYGDMFKKLKESIEKI